jgi:hypothetical protein
MNKIVRSTETLNMYMTGRQTAAATFNVFVRDRTKEAAVAMLCVYEQQGDRQHLQENCALLGYYAVSSCNISCVYERQGDREQWQQSCALLGYYAVSSCNISCVYERQGDRQQLQQSCALQG